MGRVSQLHTNDISAVAIPLTRGLFAAVDASDSELVSKHKWHLELPMPCADAVEVSLEYAIQRARECRTLGQAIEACAGAAGLDLDKVVSGGLHLDPAQLSRWQAGTEGIKMHKLQRLMAYCKNKIPAIWIVLQSGFDPHCLRPSETELARQLRVERERHQQELAAERERNKADKIRADTLMEAFRMRGVA